MYKIYEESDFGKIHDVYQNRKTNKIKINNIFVDKYEITNINTHFEQKYHSRTAIGILMK